MVLVKRRTSVFEKTAILVPTPRKTLIIKMSQANISVPPSEHPSTIEESPNHSFEKSQQIKSSVKFREEPRSRSSLMSTKIKTKSLTQPRNSYLKSEIDEKIDFESDSDVQLQDKDLAFKPRDSNLHSKSSPKRRLPALGNVKTFNSSAVVGSERSKTIGGDVRFTNQVSATSLLRLDDSKIVADNLNNFGTRPLAIDNNDIEGEHPG